MALKISIEKRSVKIATKQNISYKNHQDSALLCKQSLGASSPILLNFALEYDNRKVQETNLGLDMNGTHQVLAYADDVNLIGDDIRAIERNADVLLNACKDIGLAVNMGKLSTWKQDVIEA